MATRAHVYRVGKYIDVSATAAEAGCSLPLSLSARAWNECVAWDEDGSAQSERGRLWDVLSMTAITEHKGMGSGQRRVEFSLLCVPRGGEDAELVRLVWEYWPDESRAPYATVMLPNED